MTNFIPIFPLSIVVYPGEDLNLHIFEPRYKQLISECNTTKKPFGIPTVIDKKMKDFGSLVTDINEHLLRLHHFPSQTFFTGSQFFNFGK
jgi:hypothetical protein